MPDRYQAVLLFGAPGSGKGTQGKILSQIPGFFHLSMGDVFRALDSNSEIGRTFVQFSSQGLLVPDDLTVRMWSNHMHAKVVERAYKPEVDLLVLDGVPRNVGQSRLMHRYLNVLAIVHLVCDDVEQMIARLRKRALKEGRIDDAREDTIRKRWEVYERETRPVLEQYPGEIVHRVNAVASPAGVLENVLRIMVPIQEDHFNDPL